VTVYAGRAYALGTVGHLHCFDAASGAVLWKKNFVAEHRAQVPGWGIACAPRVDGPLVFVMVGGQPAASVMALDTRNGAVRWTALDDPISYSSPMLIVQTDKRVVVCLLDGQADRRAGRREREALLGAALRVPPLGRRGHHAGPLEGPAVHLLTSNEATALGVTTTS
jgi:hypothetical protein